MPHGAPDYWGISVRPSFGGARSDMYFDNVNFVYVIGLMPGITFESSIEILYQETYGRTPVVRSQIIYTEI